MRCVFRNGALHGNERRHNRLVRTAAWSSQPRRELTSGHSRVQQTDTRTHACFRLQLQPRFCSALVHCGTTLLVACRFWCGPTLHLRGLIRPSSCPSRPCVPRWASGVRVCWCPVWSSTCPSIGRFPGVRIHVARVGLLWPVETHALHTGLYTTRAGDTLSGIAMSFRRSVRSLREANASELEQALVTPTRGTLRAGVVLRIPQLQRPLRARYGYAMAWGNPGDPQTLKVPRTR